MGEKDLENIQIDFENECKHYKKLYDDLVQSSQSKEEKLCNDFFKKEEENDKLKNEIAILRKIILELSKLLSYE